MIYSAIAIGLTMFDDYEILGLRGNGCHDTHFTCAPETSAAEIEEQLKLFLYPTRHSLTTLASSRCSVSSDSRDSTSIERPASLTLLIHVESSQQWAALPPLLRPRRLTQTICQGCCQTSRCWMSSCLAASLGLGASAR